MNDKKALIVSLDSRRDESNPAKTNGELFQGVKCEAPIRPSWIKGEARKHWEMLCEELEKLGLLARLDQGSLGILCSHYGHMVEAKKELDKTGMFQKTPNNYEQYSPQFTAFMASSAAYNKLAAQYGLTLRSRKQMDMRNPNQQELEL